MRIASVSTGCRSWRPDWCVSAWGWHAAQSPAAPAECDVTGVTPVSLQLQWEPQAQFAGYFAAKRQGLLRRARA